MIYTESPANPTCRLTDLDAVGQIAIDFAKTNGVKKPWVMCDSTFATPFHQRCCETAGVDVAIHSATKYAIHSSLPLRLLPPCSLCSPTMHLRILIHMPASEHVLAHTDGPHRSPHRSPTPLAHTGTLAATRTSWRALSPPTLPSTST